MALPLAATHSQAVGGRRFHVERVEAAHPTDRRITIRAGRTSRSPAGYAPAVRVARSIAAVVVFGLGVRLVRSRRRRSLHPDGRSFTGELQVWGPESPIGSGLVDRPGRHPVTVRLSKGVGTRGDRPDVLGLAIRVHRPERGEDLLLSTAGTGRFSRHLPALRRDFDTWYGSISAYRTGEHRKVYLGAGPDPGGAPLGGTLESVAAAARDDRARLLLYARRDDVTGPFARIVFGAELPPATDAALAFDPIRNSPSDLRPTGLVHGLRGLAYPLSRRWRGA